MKIFAALLLIPAVLFLAVAMGTLVGGIGGWIVGGVFVDTITALKQALGLDVTNFELGAMLGFVGSFFKSHSNSKE